MVALADGLRLVGGGHPAAAAQPGQLPQVPVDAGRAGGVGGQVPEADPGRLQELQVAPGLGAEAVEWSTGRACC